LWEAVYELQMGKKRVGHVLEENRFAVDEVKGYSLWAGVG